MCIPLNARFLARSFDFWVCEVGLLFLELWLALFTVNAVAVSSEQFVASSVRTKFLYKIALQH